MGFFNSKELGDKFGSLKKMVSDSIDEAKLGEKFEQAKNTISDSISDVKDKTIESQSLRDEAKKPIDGAIIRYQVTYKGGFDNKPQKKSDSLSLGLNIMEDSFIFKPEYLAKQEWFGDNIVTIPYDTVIKFEITKRQVSTTEYMLSSHGETKSLEQFNNIEITYLDNGNEKIIRAEMLTGLTVFGQAEKCKQMMDLLREKNILSKLNKEKSVVNTDTGNDVLSQIEKLADFKNKGIISEQEFDIKKIELLNKL